MTFQDVQIDLGFLQRARQLPCGAQVKRFVETTGELFADSGHLTFESTQAWPVPTPEPAQVLGEICISAAEWPYKVFQLEKDLQLIGDYLITVGSGRVQADEALDGEQVLQPALFLFFNAGRQDAQKGVMELHNFLNGLRSAPDITFQVALSSLTTVYTPFRNVYTELTKIEGRLGNVESTMETLGISLKKVESNMENIQTRLNVLCFVLTLFCGVSLYRNK